MAIKLYGSLSGQNEKNKQIKLYGSLDSTQKQTKPIENRGGVYMDEEGKLQFPLTRQRPQIDLNLKISAPTGAKPFEEFSTSERIKISQEGKADVGSTLREMFINSPIRSALLLTQVPGRAFTDFTTKKERTGNIGQDIVNSFKTAFQQAEFEPKNKFEEVLTNKAKEEKFTFENLGEDVLSIGGEEFAEKHKDLALATGIIFAGLDLAPIGGPDDGIKAIVKLNKIDDALKLGRTIGIADDLLEGFTEGAIKVKNVKQAKELVENYAKLQKTTSTKIASKSVSEAPIELYGALKGKKGIKPQPLAQEARKVISLDRQALRLKYNEIKPLAEKAQVEINALAKNYIKRFGGELADPGIKTSDSWARKVFDELGGDYTKITDTARNSIITDNPKTLFDNLKNDPRVIKSDWKSNLTNDLGFEGGNIRIKTKNGVIAEIQQTTADIQFAKSPIEEAKAILGIKKYREMVNKYGDIGGQGHLLYEKWRVIEDPTSKEAINIATKSKNYYKQFISQPTRLTEQAGVLGAESKLPSSLKATTKETSALKAPQKGISAKQVVSPLAKSDEVLSPLSSSYKKSVDSAIAKTAEQIKEKPTIVKRVVDSVRRARTNVIEYVQNSEERVRQLVNRKGVKVDDVSDPYLKSTLYSGRVNEKITQGKEELKGIVGSIKKVADESKTNTATIRKELNDYLRFRHAPERNLALGDGAAGITTKEARAGLKALENSPRGKKIIELANKAQILNNKTLDTLKESGVITDDLYNTLRTKYKNHVPLQRIFEETDDIGSVLSGKGFDVRSTGIKKAVGSSREVDDILANISTNYEQAILRAEKNIVDNSTLAFVRKNKDILGDLFEIKKPKALGKTFDDKILRERTTDPTILTMFEKGKPVWIKINDPNLATALRGVGREKIPSILNPVAQFTRLYSGLATRFNPEFALSNKIRDLQETAVYLAAQKNIGFKGASKAVARDLAQENTKGVLDAIRGIDSKGARLYNEMKELGGTTGGFGLSTKKQVKMSIENLERLANSKTRRIGNNLIEYVDKWNTIFEDSTRLTVYRQSLDQGLSKQRAAFMAKEASINFNRMGKAGPVVNAIWMFSNASIQGSVKMIRSLKNPKVLGATVAVVGSATAAVNQWNDMADPEWRDKVSKWDRLNGLPIVLPTEGEGFQYFTIPVSWGIKPIKVASDYAYDAISGVDFNAQNFVEDTTTAILEAYNPIGGSDLVSALTPTVLDLPVDLARNRTWSGYKIKPDYDPNAPEDIKYFDSLEKTKTGQTAISISEALQKYASIAVSPADMKYAYDQYVGGAGRAISKTINTITGVVTGKPIPLDEYPFVSRFLRQRTAEEVGSGAGGDTEKVKELLGEQSRDRFMLQKEAERMYNELKELPREEANAKANEIKKNNPQLFDKLKGISKDTKLNLNYTERLIKQLGVTNGERARYIWQELKGLKTNKEKNAYVEELKSKNIISDTIMKQLRQLSKQ